MPEIVTTPLSYFEVAVEYAEPIIQLATNRGAVVEAIYAALKAWHISIDDMEVIQTGKPSEQGVKFKIPQKKSSFFFGPASCKFTRDDTSWDLAEETIQILDASLSALRDSAGVTLTSKKTLVALHLQPTKIPVADILRPLIVPVLANLEPIPATTMATVVKWDKRRVTIDGSAQIANGMFLRYEREFANDVSYADIAAQLQADEDALFGMLGVQEEQV
jgi:hypothetical protein